MFENWRISPELYAEKADMYLCHYEVAVGGKVQQIHQLRPTLTCLLYRNIRAVYRAADEYPTFLDNDWILKDEKGQSIHSINHPSNYIVDPGNPDYQQWVANWLKGYLDEYGFDGVYLDNCHACYEYMWGTEPGPPINPRTGQPWTHEEFKEAVIGLVNKVKETIGDRLVIGNGIFSGKRFFGGRHQYYAALLMNSKIDGITSEAWISSRGSADWYSEDDWLDGINFAAWLENNFLPDGKMFLPICENALSGDGDVVLPPDVTQEQYVTYCFSSLLLAAKTNGAHYLNLGFYMPKDYAQGLFNIDLGNPLGEYYMIPGTHVYARDYSKVKVLVNPTYEPYSVNLDGDYETLDGKPVTSTITVEPHTGTILKSA